MAGTRRKLGEILKRWGVITDQQVEESLKVAEAAGQRIGEALIELGYATESDVAKALASQFDMEYLDRYAVAEKMRRASKTHRSGPVQLFT